MTMPFSLGTTRVFRAVGSLLLLQAAASCTDGEDPKDDAVADADTDTDADSDTDTDADADTDSDTDTDDTDDTGDLPTVPVVLANDPLNGDTDVALNGRIQVTFSEAMDAASLDSAFTVATGVTGADVAGTVVASGDAAVFWPTSHLSSDTQYTVVVSTDATSARSIALASDHTWMFTTGSDLEAVQPVNLRAAGGYAILAKSAISTVPASAVTGDIAVSPAAATYITGFSLTSDATEQFSTSDQVTGRVYAADDAAPTPAALTVAVLDMELAFTDAAGRAPDVTELGAGNIGGRTLEPGVYKWGTGLLIPTDVTLSGSATDVWIFQIAQDLTVSNGVSIQLTGGAVPENVFWQVSGLVDFGTTAHGVGVVMSQTSISLRTGASVDGRLMAQTAVDLDGATVVEPAE